MKIVIIDYGLGNVRSVEKAFEFIGHTATISSDPKVIRTAGKVVLPGVGAFGDGMRELARRNLVEVVREIATGMQPFLGICIGLQLLFDSSAEAPGVKGLGIIPGTVKRFRQGITVPHMGWNQLNKHRDCPLLVNIPSDAFFYFVHSYYVVPRDGSAVVATTTYDTDFTSVINREWLFATQFHPEKSQRVGLQLLKNFARL